MIKKLYTALCVGAGLLFFDEDSDHVTLCCDEMDILNVNLHNFNLDNNFDEDDPDEIIIKRLKKISETLMAIAWYPKGW